MADRLLFPSSLPFSSFPFLSTASPVSHAIAPGRQGRPRPASGRTRGYQATAQHRADRVMRRGEVTTINAIHASPRSRPNIHIYLMVGYSGKSSRRIAAVAPLRTSSASHNAHARAREPSTQEYARHAKRTQLAHVAHNRLALFAWDGRREICTTIYLRDGEDCITVCSRGDGEKEMYQSI